MALDPETACRVTLGLMVLGAAGIGLPHRLRADRVGGPVPRQVDPPWFWNSMRLVGPPAGLTVVGFLVQPRWVEFAQVGLPPALRLAGIPFALLGTALFLWMFRHLGLNVTSTSMPREKATLVTSGPYRLVRHPMYTAVILLFGATALLTANVIVLLGGGAVFTLLALRSRLEEARLRDKFGEAYRAYQERTGRFLPRLRFRARP